MDLQIHYWLNSALCWFIVALALGGYFLTLRRLRQKWAFWLILSIGWAFLAAASSLSALGIGRGTAYLFGVWLSSYVFVIASLLLLFIKLIQVVKVKETVKE